MTIVAVFYVVALILAVIEEFRAQGQSLLAWAVILICVGLLWGVWH